MIYRLSKKGKSEAISLESISIAMQKSHLIKFLDWDSEFFGINIGRLEKGYIESRDISTIQQECHVTNINCLYWLADPSNPFPIQIAEDFGFNYVNARLTLSHDQTNESDQDGQYILSNHHIRTVNSHDLSQLKSIARISHHNTRFYADPNFSRDDCDRLYERWIENSVSGFAKQVFVAENLTNHHAEGYITCHLENAKGEIGLLAVHPLARNQNLGYQLVKTALDWFLRNGAKEIEVVTQWSSRPAVNLYQKAGFKTHNFQLWFHKWF